jgi:WD40 repeat protein
MRKSARRHQAAIAAVSLVSFLLVLAAVVSLSGWKQATATNQELSSTNAALEESEKQVSESQYEASIRGAFSLGKDNRTKEARAFLSNTDPAHRGIEWGYLWHQTQIPTGVRILDGHTHLVSTIRYSPNGKLIASGSRDKTTIIWDQATGHRLHQLPAFAWVGDMSWSQDSKRLAIASDGRAVI